MDSSLVGDLGDSLGECCVCFLPGDVAGTDFDGRSGGGSSFIMPNTRASKHLSIHSSNRLIATRLHAARFHFWNILRFIDLLRLLAIAWLVAVSSFHFMNILAFFATNKLPIQAIRNRPIIPARFR
jgi:hypothetical protein